MRIYHRTTQAPQGIVLKIAYKNETNFINALTQAP